MRQGKIWMILDHPHQQLGRQPDGFYTKDLSTTPIRYQNLQRIEYALSAARQHGFNGEDGTQASLSPGE
jgi:hypothetical protein